MCEGASARDETCSEEENSANRWETIAKAIPLMRQLAST